MLWSKKQLVQTPFATPDEQRRAKQLIYILRVLLLVIAVANIAIIIIDRQIWVQLLLLNIFFSNGSPPKRVYSLAAIARASSRVVLAPPMS